MSLNEAMDENDTFVSLRVRLADKRIESVSKRKFVPRSVLSHVFTTDIIEQAVAALHCADEERIGLARAIEERGVTTFAILVWMSAQDAIVDFRRAGCLDSRLPIDISVASRIAPSIAIQLCDEYQWQFLPHSFSRFDDDVDVEQSTIIPIIREVGPEIQGGFGSVSKVEIHPSLHNFESSAGQNNLFIRKRLYESGSEDQRRRLFRNEKRTLRLLNCLRHPNIIPLLYAYTHGTERSLLFPCIETDLSSFLEHDDRFGQFRWDFTFFSALYGLASALSNVHQLDLQASCGNPAFRGIGYHHDLRPANVLVSMDTFILADFGLSGLKPSDEKSKTAWKAGAGDYLAPECMDSEMNHQQVGRAIDVWAMGCLMAEVATYMSKGCKGLLQFQQARLTPGSFANWENRYFHDSEGNIKRSVRSWLEGPRDGVTMVPLGSLCRLVLKLLVPPALRPPLIEVCSRLAFLNVRAHFMAVVEVFTDVLDTVKSTIGSGGALMKIWFERERITAFGEVLSLQGSTNAELLPDFLGTKTTSVIEICVQIFEQMQGYLSTASIRRNDTSHKLHGSNSVKINDVLFNENETIESTQLLEISVRRFVQRLWDILPGAQLRKAEILWVDSMIQTRDIRRLGALNQNLRSQPLDIYQKGAAMAMMKQIRLEILSAVDNQRELESLQLASRDVVGITESNGHNVGEYKTQPVIIEWMYYDPTWVNVLPRERTLVMTLKAQGFNSVPKPDSLRLLHCLGFFEQVNGAHPGYGFVYEIPQVENRPSNKVETLLHLLMLSRRARVDNHLNQPFLGDKFVLAYMLTTFICGFHSIGWLHENFHSQNIVFFGNIPEGDGIRASCSEVLTKPYVLGLNKSRPGGDMWHTEGPGLSREYLDYRHPDYATTRRFRYGYDYYSLGLVLLEIGLWTPLKAWSDDRRYRGMDPHQFRDLLVQNYVPRLGPRMGRKYEDIVKVLLTDVLDPRSKVSEVTEAHEQHVFSEFFEKVVDPMIKLSEVHF